MTLALEIPDELLDEIARRAAALLVAPSNEAEPWLTHAEAAEHLAKSTSHLYTLKARGIGPPVHKDGSRNYYLASELDAWRRDRGDVA